MATKYIADTHALLWFIAGDPQLGNNAKSVLQDATSEIILPATALAEACWIVQRGRVVLSLSDVLAAVDNDPRITIYPLDRAVIERSNGLTNIGEMHDRQIVATALVLQDRGEIVALLTKDRNITTSAVVAVIW
jgi:PIN domain nuclease of toxin-antitoxin system